jgi:hypothetical protein
MEKWHFYIQGGYIGSCETNLVEIKKRFPYSQIFEVGNSVEIFGLVESDLCSAKDINDCPRCDDCTSCNSYLPEFSDVCNIDERV